MKELLVRPNKRLIIINFEGNINSETTQEKNFFTSQDSAYYWKLIFSKLHVNNSFLLLHNDRKLNFCIGKLEKLMSEPNITILITGDNDEDLQKYTVRNKIINGIINFVNQNHFTTNVINTLDGRITGKESKIEYLMTEISGVNIRNKHEKRELFGSNKYPTLKDLKSYWAETRPDLLDECNMSKQCMNDKFVEHVVNIIKTSTLPLLKEILKVSSI